MRALKAIMAVSPTGETIQIVNPAVGIYLLDAAGLDLQADALEYRVPERDGATFINSYLPSRKIIVLLALLGSSAAIQSAWRALVRKLSPRLVSDRAHPFSLHITAADGVVRACDGVFGRLEIAQTEPTYAEATLVFQASDPALYDPNEKSVSAGLGAGSGFSFPLSMPASFAETGIDNIVMANNVGDLPAWPRIVVSGPCDNPVITNETTGKKVEIVQAQDAGDYITIDMDAATVVWYDASAGVETNIIENISMDSEFWPLVPGENAVHIVADGAAGGYVAVYWHDRYVSI